MHVIIVGAGPSGCLVGKIIAEKGYDVLILEEHSEIGKPVQCTGLVSQRIGKIPKEIVVNKIKKAKFFSKGKFFEIKSKKKVFLLDREKYDKYLARKAERAGAKIKLNTRFLNFKNCKVMTSKRTYETKILVGADGPNSTVAKVCKISLPKNLLKAVQVKVKSSFVKDTVELWFGSDIAPGLFVWVVPENEEIARVGLMTHLNPNKFFDKFLEKRFENCKVFGRCGDVIRYGLIKKSVSNNVLLVGDAACQVKPFSAGGLVYGKICAEIVGKACVKALEENNFSERFFLENYEKKWKKKLGFSIKQGLLMKKFFSKIQDKPFAFDLIKNLGISKLAAFLDMDFLGKD